MTTQDSGHTRNLDGLSGIAFGAVLLAAPGIYFLWYVPDQFWQDSCVASIPNGSTTNSYSRSVDQG